MRIIIFLTSFIISQSLLGQINNVYSFNQIGWTIKLPYDLNIVDSATRAANIELGKKTIENSLKREVNFTKPINLISAAKDKLNYFNSTLTKSDSVNEKNWLIADSFTKSLFFTSFAKLPNTKIDSLSQIKTIDGVVFRKLSINLNVNDKILIHVNILTTFYKGFYFGITYLYTEKEIGQEIEVMLKESKFDK